MQKINLTVKKTFGILFFKSKQLSGSLTDLGKSVLDSPYLAFVTQTMLSDDLQLLVETSLLVGTSRSDVGLGKD